MKNTNADAQCSALGQQAAILGYLQIPVEKRRDLQARIAKRQAAHTQKPQR